jgi:hypothetical protein
MHDFEEKYVAATGRPERALRKVRIGEFSGLFCIILSADKPHPVHQE